MKAKRSPSTEEPTRIWVKAEIQRIQVAHKGRLHTARFKDGTCYDIIGEPYLLQACLELWNPPNDKFQVSYQEIKDTGWI